MDNERSRPEEPISVENKKENTTETVNSVPLQPLILKQNPKNIKGTKSLPYDFGAEPMMYTVIPRIRLWLEY